MKINLTKDKADSIFKILESKRVVKLTFESDAGKVEINVVATKVDLTKPIKSIFPALSYHHQFSDIKIEAQEILISE